MACEGASLEKWNISDVKDGNHIQKMVLMDEREDRVLGLIWNDTIELLQESLQPFHTYIISGASVAPIKEEYRKFTPGLTTQWTISPTTYLRPANATEPCIDYPLLDFMSTTEMINTIDKGNKINILAAVVDVKPIQMKMVNRRLTPLQECTIIHQEGRPIILTFWGSYIEKQGTQLLELKDTLPIILTKNLLGSPFNGISLGTTSSTFISIEPDIPQVAELQSWVDKHKDLIDTMRQKPRRIAYRPTIIYDGSNPITPLANITSQAKQVWSNIQLTMDGTTQEPTYTACPECFCSIIAPPDDKYYCYRCKRDQILLLRCRLNVIATDHSGSFPAIMYDDLAENFLGHKTREMYHMTEHELEALLRTKHDEIRFKEFTAQIRTPKNKERTRFTRLTIHQLLPKESTSKIPPTSGVKQNIYQGDSSKENQPDEQTTKPKHLRGKAHETDPAAPDTPIKKARQTDRTDD